MEDADYQQEEGLLDYSQQDNPQGPTSVNSSEKKMRELDNKT